MYSSKHFLSTFYVPSTILGAEDIKINVAPLSPDLCSIALKVVANKIGQKTDVKDITTTGKETK